MREFLSACYDYIGTTIVLVILLAMLISEVGDFVAKVRRK